MPIIILVADRRYVAFTFSAMVKSGFYRVKCCNSWSTVASSAEIVAADGNGKMFCPLIFHWSLTRPITYFLWNGQLNYHAGRNNRALTTCTLLVHSNTGIEGTKSPSKRACIFAVFLCLCYPV